MQVLRTILADRSARTPVCAPQGKHEGDVLRPDFLGARVTELVEIAREHLGEELKTVALKLEAIELAAVAAHGLPFRKLAPGVGFREGRFLHGPEKIPPRIFAFGILKRRLKARGEIIGRG